jgi:hypothetical protein
VQVAGHLQIIKKQLKLFPYLFHQLGINQRILIERREKRSQKLPFSDFP